MTANARILVAGLVLLVGPIGCGQGSIGAGANTDASTAPPNPNGPRPPSRGADAGSLFRRDAQTATPADSGFAGTDSGSAIPDSGPAATDSGASTTDAGAPDTDSGPGSTDGGPGSSDALARDALVALYTFDGTGRTAFDTSGVQPALDMNMYGTGVRRIESGVVFELTDNPIIVTPGPAQKILERIRASDEITVELWSRATVLDQAGPARMVGIAVRNHRRNLSILHGPRDCHDHAAGHWYQIRVLNVGEDNGCDPSVTPAIEANVTLQLAHVVFTQRADGQQRLYVDGAVNAEDMDADQNFDHFYDDTPLAFGNEPNDGSDATSRDPARRWQGELYLVAIHDRALTTEEVRRHFRAGYRAWSSI